MNYIFDTGLVVYLPLYKLDGASFVSADAYGHPCTATGALWRPDGRYFDGADDSIIIPYNAAYDVSTAFSAGAWCKPDTSYYGIIIGRDSTTVRLWKFIHNVNRFETHVWEGGVLKSYNTAGNYPNEAWYHCFFTYAYPGMERFYVNGNLILENATTAGTSTSVNIGLALGIRMGGLTEDYKGIIREAWFYNKELPQVEIQRNYLATKWRYK